MKESCFQLISEIHKDQRQIKQQIIKVRESESNKNQEEKKEIASKYEENSHDLRDLKASTSKTEKETTHSKYIKHFVLS